MKHYAHLADLQALVGQELGHSDWLLVDRHASTSSPRPPATTNGSTPTRRAPPPGPSAPRSAHGFLTLSLLPALFETGFAIDDVRMGVNYGLNRVRFPAPVRSGSRLRDASSCCRTSRWPAAPSSPWSRRSNSKARPSRPAWPNRCRGVSSRRRHPEVGSRQRFH